MSKELYDRNYLVRISDVDSNGSVISIEIRPPFNISFDCHRLTKHANTLDISIFGLGAKKREILSKRTYENAQGFVVENGELVSNPIDGLKKANLDPITRRLQIELYIAYGNNSDLNRVYLGEINQVNNSLSSSGFETRIESSANFLGRTKAFVARTIKIRRDAIEQLMTDAGYEVGKIELVNSDYIRPKILSGAPEDILRQMADGVNEKFYTDANKAYFIPVDTQATNRNIQVRADTGLLNTPTRNGQFINFKSMINQDFAPDSFIEVESLVDPTVNGVYQIFDMVYIGEYEGAAWSVDILAKAIGDTLRP